MQEVGTVSSAAKTFIENGLSPSLSIKARNLNLHAETVDVVRLFFLYQDNIETRLVRIKKGNEMALEFLAQINEQIVGLSQLAEELEGPIEGRPSQRESSKQSDRLNYLIKPQQVQSQLRGQFSHGRSQTYNGSMVQRESHLATLLVNRTAEDLRRSQIIADLVEKKESVVSEIHRSQAALEFILNYLQGMGSGHARQPHQANIRDYSSWLVDNLDVQDFLEETYKFFHQVSRAKTHTPGASGSSAGFGAEKNGSQSDTPKGIKSTANSGQGPFSQTQMSPSENHNSFLPQIAKLKRESEQKTLEINNLTQDKEELREQCARLAEKYNSLENLANKISKERDELLQQTKNRDGRATETEREAMKLKTENSNLHESLGQLKYELNAANQQLEALKQNLESLESQQENRTKELQEARNAYIILEAAYKELLADFTEFRSRELLGESTKNQAETTFKEIGLILAALEEKNDWLENQNSSLNQRNTYLEERMSQLNQAMADLVRETCLLKKQLVVQEVNRGKKPDADGLDEEMQKYLKDEAYLIQDENLKLSEDVELLRRRIESLSSENKHLHQQLKSKLAGKSRSSSVPRRRESVGPVRQDSDRSFQYQRGSPNGSILDALKDPHSMAEEPDIDYLSMLATQAMWLSKAVDSGAL